MARDYALNATVPAPRTPIGEAEFGGKRVPVFVSEEWRRQWFEPVGGSLFGETGEDDVTQGLGAGGEVVLGTGTSGNYVATISGDPTKGLNVAGGSGEGTTNAITLAQDIQTSATPAFDGLTINGNITVTGTVDGRDVAADGTALDALPATIAGKVTKTTSISDAPVDADEAHTEPADFAAVKTALDALAAKINAVGTQANLIIDALNA